MLPNQTKKSPFIELSDDKLIEFITVNIKNETLLADYFTTSTKPLSANILTIKLSSVNDESLKLSEYNFLGYAGWRFKSYFKDLVRLATPDAIDAALAEEPVKVNSPSSLHIILSEQARYQKKGVLELIEKASPEVITTAAMKMHLGLNPLVVALSNRGADGAIVSELIRKINRETLNNAAKMIYTGCTILEVIIHLKKYSQPILDTLLDQLDRETMDFLMLTPGTSGELPLIDLLVGCQKNNPGNDLFICTVIAHTSSATLTSIAQQRFGVFQFNLLTLLIQEKCSEKIIDAIFSQLDKKILNELALASYMEDIKLAPIVRHLDKETLKFLMRKPVNFKKHGVMTSDFLDNLAEYTPLLNGFIKKMLLEGERIHLSKKTLQSLDTFNLSRYFAQHPEILLQTLKLGKAPLNVTHWRYQLGHNAHFQEAYALCNEELLALRTLYESLKNKYLIDSLAKLVIHYLEPDKCLINRFDYELMKEKHPTEILELAKVYPEIKSFLPHDESSLVLNYVADHPSMVDVAVENVKSEPALSEKSKTETLSPTHLAISFFAKKRLSPLTESLKKLNRAKHLLADFTLKHQKREGSTSLLHFTRYGFKNTPLSRETLERNLRQARQDYLKVVMHDWGNFVKKSPPTHQLIMEASSFGFDCIDMKHEGNCFFHAVASQMTLQGLSPVGASHEVLRTITLDYLITHLEDYKNFMDEYEASLDAFIGQNIHLWAWADYLMISALSRALNVNLAIIKSDGEPPTIFKQPYAIATLYLGLEVGQHYQSLVENRALPKTKFLQTYIIAASAECPSHDSQEAEPLYISR